MAIDTLLPQKLGREEDSYKSVIELDEVLSSAEKLRIKNIALTGPYGTLTGKGTKSGKCEIFAQKRANYVKINLENSTNYVKNAYKIMRICDLQIANSTNY